MNENEDTSETTPPQAPASTNDTSGSDSPPPSPPPPANPSKESPGKASKVATNAGKPDAKKKCKIRFDLDLSENQIDNIFKGTVVAKAPMTTKLGVLRSIVQQIKVSDLRDFAFNALSPGADRAPDGGDSGSDQ